MDLFQREHPEILAEIGVGYGKKWTRCIQIKVLMSETGQDRTKELLLRTNRKSNNYYYSNY